MKAHFCLWLPLPLAFLACSSGDPTRPAADANGGAASGSAGAAASAGASGGAGEAAGGAGGGSGASASSGAGGEMSGGGSGGGASSAGGAGVDAGDPGGGDQLDDGTMTFFVTSTGLGNGGNLGGLRGADAFCTELALAESSDFARRSWRAYLSTSTENAGERIGTGPWRNSAGVIVANDLAQLHDQGASGALNATWPIGNPATVPLDEQGNQVPNNLHDILTGTRADGTLDPGLTCEDWTSNEADPEVLVRVGHSNRTGGGQDPSWTTTHTVGCSQDGTPNITEGGGRGSLYCFALIIER